MKKIQYKKINWKYVLTEKHEQYVPVLGCQIEVKSVSGLTVFQLGNCGTLKVFPGYAWDGASGPTFDTEDTMRASLIHDILYQCVREGLLGREYLDVADRVFKEILMEDGMPVWRAWYWFHGVNNFYVHNVHGRN